MYFTLFEYLGFDPVLQKFQNIEEIHTNMFITKTEEGP